MPISRTQKIAGFAVLMAIFLVMISLAAPSQISTRRLSSDENPRLMGAVFDTEKSGRPGILILHGSAGLLPHYREWATRLSRAGFVTLLVDLNADTGSPAAGSEDRFKYWPVWQAVANRGLAWLRNHPKVDAARIGVIGFSRGAWIALTTPLRDIRAFVNLYGVGKQSLDKGWDPMPPTLMFYGGRDQWASADFIARLESTLKGRSRSVSTVIYPEAGHGFTLQREPMPGADSEAAEDAWQRILAFLEQTLGPI